MNPKLLLVLSLASQAFQGKWRDDCKSVISAFDDMDPLAVAKHICPIIGVDENVCDGITPYITEWLQDHSDPDIICADLCITDFQGDYGLPIE